MQLLSCWPQKPRAMDSLPGNSVLRSGTCSGPSSTKSRAQVPLPTAFHVLVWGHGRFCSLPDPLLVTRVSRPCSHTHRPQHDPAAAGQAAEQEPGTASGSHQGAQPARGPGQAASAQGLAGTVPRPHLHTAQPRGRLVEPLWPLLAHLPFVLCSPVVEGCWPAASWGSQCGGAQPSPVSRGPMGLPSCPAWPLGGSRTTAPLSIGWAGRGARGSEHRLLHGPPPQPPPVTDPCPLSSQSRRMLRTAPGR